MHHKNLMSTNGSKDAPLEDFSFKDKLKMLAFLFIGKTHFNKMDVL